MNTLTDKRSGKERRMTPPSCTVPCPPMILQNKEIVDCLNNVKKDKVSNQLYYWSFGALCFFVVIIVGGFQWTILRDSRLTSEAFLRDVSIIKSNIAVSAEKVNRAGNDIQRHLIQSDTRFNTLEKNINTINQRYYESFQGRQK